MRKRKKPKKKYCVWVLRNYWEFNTLPAALNQIRKMIYNGHYEARLFCPQHTGPDFYKKFKAGKLTLEN